MPPVKTTVPRQAAPVYDAYLGWLASRGVGSHTFDSGARCFLARYPDPQAWAELPLGARLAGTRPHLQPLLNFLMLHRQSISPARCEEAERCGSVGHAACWDTGH